MAVALKYDLGKMNAPVCLAKGYDEVAQKIKAIAAEYGIPMVENIELARALAREVQIGQPIAGIATATGSTPDAVLAWMRSNRDRGRMTPWDSVLTHLEAWSQAWKHGGESAGLGNQQQPRHGDGCQPHQDHPAAPNTASHGYATSRYTADSRMMLNNSGSRLA